VKKYGAGRQEIQRGYLSTAKLGIRSLPTPRSIRSRPGSQEPDVVPFLLKKDAKAYATRRRKLCDLYRSLGAINVGQ